MQYLYKMFGSGAFVEGGGVGGRHQGDLQRAVMSPCDYISDKLDMNMAIDSNRRGRFGLLDTRSTSVWQRQPATYALRRTCTPTLTTYLLW